jgi:hypothetical protein
MQEEQITFYNWVAVTLSTLVMGLMLAAYWGYGYMWAVQLKDTTLPSPKFLAFPLVAFMFSAVAAIWGMTHFQTLMASHRKMKRAQIDKGIQAMQEKLKQTVVLKKAVR